MPSGSAIARGAEVGVEYLVPMASIISSTPVCRIALQVAIVLQQHGDAVGEAGGFERSARAGMLFRDRVVVTRQPVRCPQAGRSRPSRADLDE